jgi:hypothetical protein
VPDVDVAISVLADAVAIGSNSVALIIVYEAVRDAHIYEPSSAFPSTKDDTVLSKTAYFYLVNDDRIEFLISRCIRFNLIYI